MSVIRCDVVAKNKVLFSGELYNVMVPGTEGELGIMENHEPFVSALKDGVIWARTQQEGGEVLSCHHGWLCPGVEGPRHRYLRQDAPDRAHQRRQA